MSRKGRAVKFEEPVTITLWNYYSGDLLNDFNALVDEFNDTHGEEVGIYVESYSHSDVNELASMVTDAVDGVPHAAKAPNIFSAYADTAYELDKRGKLVDLSKYLTAKEINAFVDGYMDEGRFGNGIKILPVAKAVEVLVLNRTDWDRFSAEASVDIQMLDTIEGVTAAAEMYYNWSDARTAKRNDGKALFGRDAVANYVLSGAMQLGTEILQAQDGKVTLDFDRDTMRKIWDNYYVPMVKGYFCAESRFRSDDMKTGSVIAYVGSSSGTDFVPTMVATNDDKIYSIETEIRPCPRFADSDAYAAQLGAGMVVLKGQEAEVQASVEFLKWLTQAQRNITFSVNSGYLPVTEEANEMLAENMRDYGIPETSRKMMKVAVETVETNELYTPHAFDNANLVRSLLEYGMSDLAAADRIKVKERLEQGMKLKEAAAEFLTDEYFDSWYESTLAQLEQLCG